MKNFVRILGDEHGDFNHYLNRIKDVPYSIQVGDLGMNYRQLRGKFNTDRHKAIFGNHDVHDQHSEEYFLKQPFSLGKFGTFQFPEGPQFFFLSGAWSIDWKWRQQWNRENPGKACWWAEEELSYGELQEAIDLYKEVKPDYVITHECPYDIVAEVTNPNFCLQFGYPAGTIRTRTNTALQEMFEYYQPKGGWFFGHFHTAWNDIINGTHFHCLDMARSTEQNSDYYDLEI